MSRRFRASSSCSMELNTQCGLRTQWPPYGIFFWKSPPAAGGSRAGLRVPGGRLFVSDSLPSSLSPPASPAGLPTVHVAILSWGVGDASKVLSGAGGRGLGPARLLSGQPGPRIALPARLKPPACRVPCSGWTSPSLKTPGREMSRSLVAATCTRASAPSRPHPLLFH